jgi:flagellin
MENNKEQVNCVEATITDLQEGVLLVQAADIALKEVQSLLNQMLELAEQAANGEYRDAAGRKAMDDEFQRLKEEIDDIIREASFDGLKMLDGTVHWTIKAEDKKLCDYINETSS